MEGLKKQILDAMEAMAGGRAPGTGCTHADILRRIYGNHQLSFKKGEDGSKIISYDKAIRELINDGFIETEPYAYEKKEKTAYFIDGNAVARFVQK